MGKENALNKGERTTIRTDIDTRERINELAQQNGMTQEKFLKWMVDQVEAGIPKSVDQPSQSTGVNNYDLLVEIKSVKKVVYRMIKELCRITASDVNDPDSGITMRARYDDMLLHPEKYRRRYTSPYGKEK